MSIVKTAVIKEGNAAAWDDYIQTHAEAHYCHLFDWSHVIEEVYQHKPFYLTAVTGQSSGFEKNGTICGIFPLFEFKALTRKARFISIPFFDQAGILAKNHDIASMLFAKAIGLLRTRGTPTLEIRQAAPSVFSELPELINLGSSVSTMKVSLKLKLGMAQEEMMNRFKSKLRSQIKKGMKNGLKSCIGKQELIDPFYDVFSRNMRDLGSPVHSKKLFKTIFKYFHHDAFICIVTYQSQPVAAGFLFRFKNEISNPWASSLQKFRHLNTNMFLYWEMIRFACSLGLDCFDMGRSSSGASTYLFKKQWNPEEKQLYWYHWYTDEKQIEERPESLYIRPWKKLPMFAANLLGPPVRRNISL